MGVTGASCLSSQDMRRELYDYCEEQVKCDECVLHGHSVCEDYPILSAPDDVTQDAYDRLHPPVEVEEPVPPVEILSDNINHPDHYCRDGAMECIEEMILLFGKDVVKHFCLCNAWKYRYRAGMKDNAEEDIKKSDWYIQKYKELRDGCWE